MGLPPRGLAGERAKAVMGSRAAHQAEPAERGPAVGREGRSAVEGGLGSGADQHGTLYHYLLTGQTDSGKTDTRTSRLQEKGAGHRGPSFTSQQEMSQTPSKREG